MLKKMIKEKVLSVIYEMGEEYNFNVEIPDEKFGDFSTNAALVGAKYFRKAPREIANIFSKKLSDNPMFDDVSIAGPGFINFKISKEIYRDLLIKMLNEKVNFWKKKQNNQKVQFEYGSANPTGPFTVGHGRQIVIGDVLANVFEFLGYDVIREMYVNDAGRQVKLLGRSLWVRYNELFGEKYELPEDGYRGDYLIEIAEKLKEEIGDKYKNLWDEDVENFFKTYVVKNILEKMNETLKSIGSGFDKITRESDIIDEGLVEEVLEFFEKKGYTYEKEGALWFKVSDFVDDQDKVLVRSDGTYTYFLTDIAYHYDKYKRGFDMVYDVFGSDHQGHIPRMIAAMKALNVSESFLNFVVHQFVTLKRGKEVVKMSTRAGNFVTLDDLTREVGKDATRFFFTMVDVNSHLNFDLELAKAKSNENPVYYVQYAYARINSIFRNAKEKGIEFHEMENIELLNEEQEMSIIKMLDVFEDVLQEIKEKLSPHYLSNYLKVLAEKFHKYYNDYRVLDENNKALSNARLNLLKAVKMVFEIGFELLGVSAPEEM
ncbi:arginine--tRNA ligase [Thermosipho ferrireducens]|uniref:Arginine--tRNA ligase n=1 Tax=Thermosipho ferrireducens TaxID=2571116 RepID=A0ABX7S915_9BACT|nr:arginine--tRNA ligase [Thermosipho ferrireducens]QTA37831.1 arginine--tRNA ligase [Thermosipho ferrireducens]